ncbi:MAG TPA: hypothetical protein VE011_00540 [Candidatus Dormibacteraeota bacterium]|nr:hypothetical protein [Candidatus Dormibacteraeota bacterium]
MAAMNHAQRVLLGRLGAYTMLSRNDPHEITKAARAAFVSKFERDVDPDGVLPLEERLRRAEMARKAHYTRLALRSAEVRRKRRGQ